MKIEIADIATAEKRKLQGFKILGAFPFWVRLITTETHIKLCKVRAQIQELTEEPNTSDFHDFDLQSKLIPLINEYCVTALLNGRDFAWFFKLFLKRKIKKCSHSQILNLYLTVQKLDEPAFFLTYWNWINQKDNTLLREEKPS